MGWESVFYAGVQPTSYLKGFTRDQFQTSQPNYQQFPPIIHKTSQNKTLQKLGWDENKIIILKIFSDTQNVMEHLKNIFFMYVALSEKVFKLKY